MTEFDFKKNVKIVCTLSKGDKVKTDGFGYKLDGKILIIEDLKPDLWLMYARIDYFFVASFYYCCSSFTHFSIIFVATYTIPEP